MSNNDNQTPVFVGESEAEIIRLRSLIAEAIVSIALNIASDETHTNRNRHLKHVIQKLQGALSNTDEIPF
jgi:hypothetical protein